MDVVQAIVFGAVQGVTEFLPISSTAHLYLLPWFMGWKDPGLTFTVALHLGTLAALLLYFRLEWVQLTLSGMDLIRGRTKDPGARMALFIILATIPAAVAGVLFEDAIETTLRSPLIISITLVVLALVLVVAEQKGRRTELYYPDGAQPPIHVSGHASEEELKLVMSLVKPRYFIPIHGMYRQMHRHAQLAEKTGAVREKVIVA